MPIVVTMTMAVMVITMIDCTVPLYSSIKCGDGGNVKIRCSGVVHGWVVVSFFQTWGISFNAISVS